MSLTELRPLRRCKGDSAPPRQQMCTHAQSNLAGSLSFLILREVSGNNRLASKASSAPSHLFCDFPTHLRSNSRYTLLLSLPTTTTDSQPDTSDLGAPDMKEERKPTLAYTPPLTNQMVFDRKIHTHVPLKGSSILWHVRARVCCTVG